MELFHRKHQTATTGGEIESAVWKLYNQNNEFKRLKYRSFYSFILIGFNFDLKNILHNLVLMENYILITQSYTESCVHLFWVVNLFSLFVTLNTFLLVKK